MKVNHRVVFNSATTSWTVAFQAPLSMEFSRQEYWSELSFPSPKFVNSFKFKAAQVDLWCTIRVTSHISPIIVLVGHTFFLHSWFLKVCQMHLFIISHVLLSFLLVNIYSLFSQFILIYDIYDHFMFKLIIINYTNMFFILI